MIHPRATIRLFGKKSIIKIGRRSHVRSNTEIESINGKVIIADGVFINKNCMIVSMLEISIGSGTAIAPGVIIYDHDHDFCHTTTNDYICKPISIGKNVWIGANSVILKGVTIGDDTIIGAGSVVTKNVDSNSMYAGNPARKIKSLL